MLILDEPTASLDPETEHDLISGLEAVMEGRTTIVITHRLEVARRADRVLVLEDASVSKQGAFAGLFDVRGAAREVVRWHDRTGRGVRVAVIDSGIHADHPHIGGIAGGTPCVNMVGASTSAIALDTAPPSPRRSVRRRRTRNSTR